MPKWGIIIRRDKVYTVDAPTLDEAIEAAKCEDWTMIDEDDLDWETCLDSWNMDDVDTGEEKDGNL